MSAGSNYVISDVNLTPSCPATSQWPCHVTLIDQLDSSFHQQQQSNHFTTITDNSSMSHEIDFKMSNVPTYKVYLQPHQQQHSVPSITISTNSTTTSSTACDNGNITCNNKIIDNNLAFSTVTDESPQIAKQKRTFASSSHFRPITPRVASTQQSHTAPSTIPRIVTFCAPGDSNETTSLCIHFQESSSTQTQHISTSFNSLTKNMSECYDEMETNSHINKRRTVPISSNKNSCRPQMRLVKEPNPFKYDCVECGAKFDNILQLTEHNCYEESVNSVSNDVSSNFLQTKPSQHSSSSTNSTSIDTLIPRGFIKCVGCENLFNEDYFYTKHFSKCSSLKAALSPQQSEEMEEKVREVKVRKKAVPQFQLTTLLRSTYGRKQDEKRNRLKVHKYPLKRHQLNSFTCVWCDKIMRTRKTFDQHSRSCFDKCDSEIHRRFETNLRCILNNTGTANKFEQVTMRNAPLVCLDSRVESALRECMNQKEQDFHLASVY
ncbi:uncharacterized protein LOC142339236 isoform X3 [Convolutriloba macropyga]|uniref:uncharacterized protein LOC142339236 isoform X3 n=1 Tax=Convolutriloba macropyga TaxID=536237 RepID=UPI003F51C626